MEDTIIALIQPLFIVLFAVLGYQMAGKRNRSQVGWAIGLGMTGVVGLIVLAIMGEKEAE